MKNRPSVHQVMESCSYGDAIGNMALDHRNELREAGFKSEIYAVRIHHLLSGKVKTIPQLQEDISKDDVLIYHFSIGSEVSKLIHTLPNRLVLHYHNITPAEFFRKFHDVLMRQCALGREELKGFVKRTDLALASSGYDRQELISYGFAKTDMIPIRINKDRLIKNRSISVEMRYDDKKTNCLFVGRVIPNKKIEDVIKAFHLYKRQFDKSARLFITGSYKSFEIYLHWLQRLTKKLGIADDVIFTGHVSDEELAAYYRIADLFLMMSEHEGFCVPLMESFIQDIPVIAYEAAAVGETMHGGGILLSKKDYGMIAELMNALMTSEKYRNMVLESQKEALGKYIEESKKKALPEVIENLLAEN